MDEINKEAILKAIESSDFTLISTHDKLCPPIVNRIYKKKLHGIEFDEIKVCDSLIIDGHHRYISSLLANLELNKTKSYKTSATIKYDWTDVGFVKEEWDTKYKIQRLNELDTKFNNISIEQVMEMTK